MLKTKKRQKKTKKIKSPNKNDYAKFTASGIVRTISAFYTAGYEKALNKTKKEVISKIQKLTITKENEIVERINTAFNTHNKTLEESIEFLITIYFDVPELPELFEIIDNKFCEWVWWIDHNMTRDNCDENREQECSLLYYTIEIKKGGINKWLTIQSKIT